MAASWLHLFARVARAGATQHDHAAQAAGRRLGPPLEGRDPLRHQLWPVAPDQATEAMHMFATKRFRSITVRGVHD